MSVLLQPKRPRDLGVNILMYHSISLGPGPTCIPPQVFREQMQALEDLGYSVVGLADFAAFCRRNRPLPPRAVVITFDDGFLDFAEQAFPALHKRGWSATVFLPTGVVGKSENWRGALSHQPRKLMDWRTIRQLAGEGIEFGGHTITHCDMTRLSPQELERETRLPGEQIKQETGIAAMSFAPPYGFSNAVVRAAIRKWYQVSVGVRFHRAKLTGDLSDVPRIEMHYFRNIAMWRAYLQGRAETYVTVRRALRHIRRVV